MRKITVELKMKMMISVNDGVEVSEIIDELDYTIVDTTSQADILDTEILDYEVIDSK